MARPDDESLSVKKGRKDLRLDLHTDGRFLLSTDRRLHLYRARADLQRLLDLAVEELGLNPTPPLPSEPDPPPAIDLDQPEPDDDSSPDSLWWEWMASPWDPSQQQLGGPRLGPV